MQKAILKVIMAPCAALSGVGGGDARGSLIRRVAQAAAQGARPDPGGAGAAGRLRSDQHPKDRGRRAAALAPDRRAPRTAAMRHALARHDQIMSDAIAAAGGYAYKTIGDAFQAAFA